MEVDQNDEHYQPASSEVKNYGSRTRKIGNITCHFKNWYRDGKYPYWNIGPSYGPMVFMIIFALCIFSFFSWVISAAKMNWYIASPLYLIILYNLNEFKKTMLSNPGIDDTIFDHYRNIEFN